MDPLEVPKKNPTEKPPEEKYFSEELKTLRTYQGDMADALREQQGSVIKIAMAEQKKKDEEQVILSPTSRKNIGFIFLSVIALLLGASIFVYLHFFKKEEVIIVDRAPTISSLVFAEHTEAIPTEDLLTRKQFGEKIANHVSATVREPGLTNLVLTVPTDTGTRLLTTEEILTKLESSAPTAFIRSLASEFMLGIHTSSTNAHPFLIFTGDSYEAALAGMLAWETMLFDATYSLFAVPIEGTELFEKDFQDIIIDNRDGRVLRKVTGEPVLMYVFLNTETIIITDNIATVREIIDRLDAQDGI